MIEEIKLLLPLLQQATSNAMWLAGALIAKDLLLTVLGWGVLAWMVLRVGQCALSLSHSMDLVKDLRDKHQLGYGELERNEIASVRQMLRDKDLL